MPNDQEVYDVDVREVQEMILRLKAKEVMNEYLDPEDRESMAIARLLLIALGEPEDYRAD